MAFKYRQSDKEKLRREVRRYNSKVNKLRNNPKYQGVTLPKTLKVKDIEKTFNERSDFNRTLNSIQRWLKPGATKVTETKAGLKITAYEKQEFGIRLRTLNRERNKQLKNVSSKPVIAGNRQTGLTRGQVEPKRMEGVQPRKVDVNKIRSRSDFHNVLESLDRELNTGYTAEQEQRYKDNYIKALRGELGVLAEDLIEKVNRLTPADLLNIYYTEQEGSIAFIYDPIEVQARHDYIEDVLDRALSDSGYRDND